MAVSDEMHATEIAEAEINQEGETEQGKAGQDSESARVSRAEKKTFKQLQKLGLKQVTGFKKCEIRRNRSYNSSYPIVVNDPIVFEVPGKVPSYIILGAIRVDELKEQLRAFQQQQMASTKAGIAPTVVDMSNKAAAATVVADEDIDTTGLSEEDIKLAITQTGRTKAQVVTELRKSGGDVIEAIMQLSS